MASRNPSPVFSPLVLPTSSNQVTLSSTSDAVLAFTSALFTLEGFGLSESTSLLISFGSQTSWLLGWSERTRPFSPYGTQRSGWPSRRSSTQISTTSHQQPRKSLACSNPSGGCGDSDARVLRTLRDGSTVEVATVCR